MDPWIFNALLAMFFAGITAVLAKYGMGNVHPDVALAVRTAMVFALVSGYVIVTNRFKELPQLTTRDAILLAASGLATTLSWIFYYRAMKHGPVAYVAAIDKASILITIILAFFLLGEPLTPKLLVGGFLILAGLVVLTVGG